MTDTGLSLLSLALLAGVAALLVAYVAAKGANNADDDNKQ